MKVINRHKIKIIDQLRNQYMIFVEFLFLATNLSNPGKRNRFETQKIDLGIVPKIAYA